MYLFSEQTRWQHRSQDQVRLIHQRPSEVNHRMGIEQ
jgi:hypothetical protein